MKISLKPIPEEPHPFLSTHSMLPRNPLRHLYGPHNSIYTSL